MDIQACITIRDTLLDEQSNVIEALAKTIHEKIPAEVSWEERDFIIKAVMGEIQSNIVYSLGVLEHHTKADIDHIWRGKLEGEDIPYET